MSKKTITVKLADAQLEELRSFARDTMGLDVPATANVKTLIARIKAAGHQGDDITVLVDEEIQPMTGTPPQGAAAPGAAMMRSRGGKGDPVAVIRVNASDGPGGDRPVFVSVNGTGITIPRDEEVQIPYRYVEVLRNAIQDVYHHDTKTDEIIGRKVQSYPFQVISMPSRDEIDAWMERTKDKFAA